MTGGLTGVTGVTGVTLRVLLVLLHELLRRELLANASLLNDKLCSRFSASLLACNNSATILGMDRRVDSQSTF